MNAAVSDFATPQRIIATYDSGDAYTIPPMIAPVGAWTMDGTHPTNRGAMAMIAQTGFSAAAFAF
jgi:hypothetical protein